MTSRYLYLKRTSTTGAVTLTDHVCWDSELFFATQQKQCDEENARAQRDTGKPPEHFASVEPLTKAQFQAARAPRAK